LNDNRGPFRWWRSSVRKRDSAIRRRRRPPHGVRCGEVLGQLARSMITPSMTDGGTRKTSLHQGGWGLVGSKLRDSVLPNTFSSRCAAGGFAVFGEIERRFYPQNELDIHAKAPLFIQRKLGEGVVLAPGRDRGPRVARLEWHAHRRYSVIGRRRDHRTSGGDRIATSAWLRTKVGDDVLIQPGVWKIGASGFGFWPGHDGHIKIPQLGRCDHSGSCGAALNRRSIAVRWRHRRG